MTRRSRVGFVIAAAFTFINVGGAALAVVSGEWMHAVVHFALIPVGMAAAWWFARPSDAVGAGVGSADSRLDELQRSVDAIALEVERVGEAQRYIAKKAAEQAKVERPTEK